MRWVTFRKPGSRADRVGVIAGMSIHAARPGVQLLDLLARGPERLQREGERLIADPHEVFETRTVTLRAPVPHPPSVRDFYAFEQHVKAGRTSRGLEMDPDWYKLPVFYFTNPAAITGPNDPVAVPPGCQELDFELEVAVIVGRAGSNLKASEAESYVAGYTIMNDWSARDLARREMRLNLGPAKGKDFATTLGPYMVTPDEIESAPRRQAPDLTMRASVNGREYSRASLADIYWSFGDMLAYASRGTTLQPGDVLGSGTCGTGCLLELRLTRGEAAYPWLKPGDVVELNVDRLGSTSSRVVEGPAIA